MVVSDLQVVLRRDVFSIAAERGDDMQGQGSCQFRFPR